MFTRRRSRGFLLDTVNRGAEFVETLNSFYPKADALNGKDFDWLFDCPETAQFLDWFCNTVGEENVLSPKEVKAYETLLSLGKPILEGEALDQVLQTCCQCPQLKGAMSEDEALPLEVLEWEAQALHHHRARQLQRYNRLQICAAGLKQELHHLVDKGEKVGRELRKIQLDLELENSQINSVLSQACKVANQLVEWYQDTGNGRLLGPISEADLSRYLVLEDQATGALMAFIRKTLAGSTHALDPEGTGLQEGKRQDSCQENLATQATAGLAHTMLPENRGHQHEHVADPRLGAETQKELIRRIMAGLPWKALPEKHSGPQVKAARVHALCGQEGGQEMAKGLEDVAQVIPVESMGIPEANPLENLGSYQKELKYKELAYICHQKELIITLAEADGVRAGLQWAERALKTSKDNKMLEDELRLHIATLQDQLQTIEVDRDQIQTQHLVPLLQASARLLRLPVLWGQLDGEAVHLGYTTLRQEEFMGQLMAQHSRLEVLGMQLQLEKQQQQQVGTWLEETVDVLKDASANLQRRLTCFEDSSLYIKICPHTLIDPSDLTTVRLWEMLEKQGQEKPLFRTYETLASRGSHLCQEQRMLEVQLAVSPSQLPKLESDNEMLYQMMYSDSNQLLLNAQELANSMEQLYTTQATLHQMLLDLLSDLKAKRKSLQSHFQQMERDLYVHFFHDVNRLREVVQQLEKQAVPFS